jgi:predicted metalloprotease with PDZ domain
MIHLGMPVFDLAASWFTEGFTTYYQEVLRSRCGMTTPEKAWARMEEGFEAGARKRSDVPLAEASRRMRETHEYRRVYWAGAAMALEVDVALRREPAGAARSLDDVIRWLHRTYRASAQVRTADEVTAGADAWMGRAVFADVMRRRLSTPEFPDVAPLRTYLGFEPVAGGGWRRRRDAPGAAIATAIFGTEGPPPEAPAPAR